MKQSVSKKTEHKRQVERKESQGESVFSECSDNVLWCPYLACFSDEDERGSRVLTSWSSLLSHCDDSL